MSSSTRGVARRFLNLTGALGLRKTFFPGQAGPLALRQRLESLARQDISFSASECVFGWTVRYEQIWSHIRVRIQLNPDPGITAMTMSTLQATWEIGMQNAWSGRWSLARKAEAACPITVDVQWVNSNAHQTVRVQTGPAPTNMGIWDTSDSGAVAAHEFGHMLGNPDEYVDPNCPARSPVNTGTIMDNNSNTLPARLLQRIADNVGSNVV